MTNEMKTRLFAAVRRFMWTSHASPGDGISNYAGALIGPMGGNLVITILPLLQNDFEVGLTEVALSITIASLPFAILQLVSGTIADLTSRHVIAVVGFVTYGAALFASGLAPNFTWFLIARAFQGAANAFTSPILMGAMADLVPPKQLGKSMAWFSSFTTGGMLMAPLIAGWAVTRDWRLAFFLSGTLSLAAALYYHLWFRYHGKAAQGAQRPTSTSLAYRSLFRPKLLVVYLAATIGNLATNGAVFIVTLHFQNVLQYSVAAAGSLVAAYHLVGASVSPFGGMVVDKIGAARAAIFSGFITAISLGVASKVVTPVLLICVYLLSSISMSVSWVALLSMVAQAAPDYRGGASSIFGSFRHIANSVAPVILTPVFVHNGISAIFSLNSLFAIGMVSLAVIFRQMKFV